MFDLTLCSEDELETIIVRARERQRELDHVARSNVRHKVVAMILAEGFMPEDIFPALARRGDEPLKYRHPQYRFLTWSGTGKTPRWYLDLLAAGYSKERLLISTQDAAPAPRLKDRRAHNRPRVTSGLFRGLGRIKLAARERQQKAAPAAKRARKLPTLTRS